VKGGIEYVGWSDAPLMDGLALPEDWLENTRRRTLEIVGQIRAGRVEIRPADPDSCRFCDSKDVCRVETQWDRRSPFVVCQPANQDRPQKTMVSPTEGA